MKAETLWDLKNLDAADLAVVVAHDICEDRINVFDYLKYTDNYEKLTGVRFCLLSGSDPETNFPDDPSDLEAIYVSNIQNHYTFVKTWTPHLIKCFIKNLQLPLLQWKNHMCVEYCSLLNIKDYNSLEELKFHLSNHLNFKYFIKCDLKTLPLHDWG